MKLTEPRRRGLEVLAASSSGPFGRGLARESNVTSPEAGYVYWQTAKWLVAEGLAEFYCPPMMQLTGKGWELAREIGVAP